VRSPLSAPGAPAAIGPYSQAQVVRLHGGNRLVFTSGQVALDPETGELKGADIAAQTEQVLRNLAAVLKGASLELADVVMATVYLADMADFQGMNQVYEKHFPSPAPARTTVAAAGLPRGARVEIEAVAVGRDL